MSHDRCYEHKCRACSKCAEVDESDVVWFPVEKICAGHDDIDRLRAENERLASEVARLKSYIANGVGGAS